MKNKIDTQKYPIDTIFESDDICFDEEYNCKVWTKQSCLDKMKLK